MPELPEVEAARHLVELGCKGKRIAKATVANDEKVLSGCSPSELQCALQGRTLVAAHRRGKYLWMQLDSEGGPWPLLHFGMTGGIVVQGLGVTKYKRAHLESDPDEWPPRFTKMELELEGGGRLAFVDSRRFARIRLLVDPPAQEPLSRLGFDVLTAMPPPQQWAEAVRARVARAPALKIKALLLDQEFCAGIGNWVGDEVLYQARIHPEQPAASLGEAALAALHGAIVAVVGAAVGVGADSARFPPDWLFHFRWTNKKASSIGGRAIAFVTVGSRTSAFVPSLQQLAGGAGGGGAAKDGAGRKRGAKAKAAAASSDDDGGAQGSSEDESDDSGGGGGGGAAAAAAAPRRGRKPAAGAAPKGGRRGGGKTKRGGGGSEEEALTDEEAPGEDADDDGGGSSDGGVGPGRGGKAKKGAKRPPAKRQRGSEAVAAPRARAPRGKAGGI